MIIFEILLILLFFTVIISFSPIGTAFAEVFIKKKYESIQFQEFEKKYLEIEEKLKEHDDELNKLREYVIFNEIKISEKTPESQDNNSLKKQENNLEKNI